jgi:lipopolysaccharide/colanic/teichoic acid biosynthesis glycosyltransferase
VRPTPRGNVPLLALEKARITGVDRVLKTVLDRGVAAALLLAAAPLLAVLLAVGCLRRCRPLWAPQRVLGLAGRPVGLRFFGPWLEGHRLLRSLPVLVNVLRGEVSLVGPRPQLAMPDPPAKLGILLAVKPGLTGLWRLAPTDAPQPDWYDDLWYVRNYTIWEDLRILYQTLWRLRQPNGMARAGLCRWQPSEGVAEMVANERPEARAVAVGR